MEETRLWKKWLAIAIHQAGLVTAVLTLFLTEYYTKQTKQGLPIGCLCIGAFSLLVAFVMMGYLASATLSSSAIDKMGGDLLVAIYLLALWMMLDHVAPMKMSRFSLSDKLVTFGVISYLYDVGFLVVYLSIVRRIKNHTLWSGSIIGRLWNLITRKLFKKSMISRALRGLIAWVLAIFGTVMFAAGKHWWGLVLIIISAVIELFFSLRKAKEQQEIRDAILEITNGNLGVHLEEEHFHGEERETAEAVNHIRDGLGAAVSKEFKNEKMKAELITNVSHDLKTPLTSIINYVGILKREIKDEGKAREHLDILDEKSQRMKSLVEDLVEVSKITSGNMKYEIMKLDFVELIYQAGGEFDERFETRNLTISSKLSRLPLYIEADGRQLFRSIENLYTNAAKYALVGSTVQVNLTQEGSEAVFTIRNIMENRVSFDGAAGDLTERFVRGDKARSSEGSGLGLSIAKNMIEQMGGSFLIQVEEDTFIARVAFKIA